jgi:hypothetical protein
MKDELVRKSMRLFASEVAPRLRETSAAMFGAQFPHERPAAMESAR